MIVTITLQRDGRTGGEVTDSRFEVEFQVNVDITTDSDGYDIHNVVPLKTVNMLDDCGNERTLWLFLKDVPFDRQMASLTQEEELEALREHDKAVEARREDSRGTSSLFSIGCDLMRMQTPWRI